MCIRTCPAVLPERFAAMLKPAAWNFILFLWSWRFPLSQIVCNCWCSQEAAWRWTAGGKAWPDFFPPSPTFSGEFFWCNLFIFFKLVCKLRLPVTIASFTPDDSVSRLLDHHLVCACWWMSPGSLPVKLPIQGTCTWDWNTVIISEGCECPSAALALLHQLSWHSWSRLVKFKCVF